MDIPFYMTGGTALGRFYLNHRFSEDLDFFMNANNLYKDYISILKSKIEKQFATDIQRSLFSDDFTRFFITEGDIFLKIEFVNDVDYYAGKPNDYQFGLIDTPLNILSNKLTAIVGRDEPKDLFDIVHISLNYSFNWQDIFFHAKQKTVINELDIEQRICSFPVEWMNNVNWLSSNMNFASFEKSVHQIADDFLLGIENTLGRDKISISKAKPLTLRDASEP